ncbi:MAG: B12-binding domain-containing radical SAM protein [Chitinophagales bacterium]|nr:B12-binding domain-containing radical SAM protein [Chitinophagales bacterium]
MKVLFINLPYHQQLTRRYMCTYVSATSLFPPYELMSAAGELREKTNVDVHLIDCIAGKINFDGLLLQIKHIQPQIILSLVGIDTFEHDIRLTDKIKEIFPSITNCIFGHYPTIFPSEILINSKTDIIIGGEPDIVMVDIINAYRKEINWSDILGISYRNSALEIKINPGKKRIKDLNMLALPAHDLINAKQYFEPLIPAPFGMIQTSRGCPFRCNFCVTSYGSKYTVKSAERIVEEIECMVKLHKIKSFRIIDDTFTIQKQRVIDICDLLISKKLNLKWTCLSRVDTLTEEMLIKMKDSGCQRIYFGIESGSQEILDYYKKDIKIDEVKKIVNLCSKIGINAAGLFMTGLPNESETQFNQTIQLAKDIPLSFAGVGELTPYPGTDLYNQLQSQIEFSLFPYRLNFKNKEISTTAIRRRTKFHRKFYFRIKIAFGILKSVLKSPIAVLQLIKHIIKAKGYGTRLYPYLHN